MNSNRLITAIAVALITAASWLTVFDARSTKYVDDAIVQSTAAFAVARGLNAIISTAQSTQVSFSIGAGLSMTVGEVLDPLNDLVEQYSSLMKVSIVSLIIQKLLIEITTDTFFKIAITASGLSAIAALLILKAPFQAFLVRVFFSFVFVRFILVFTVLANGFFEQSFLAETIQQETKTLEILKNENQIKSSTSTLTPEQTNERTARKMANTQSISQLAREYSTWLALQDSLTMKIKTIDSDLDQARAEASIIDRALRQDETIEKLKRHKNEQVMHLEATEEKLRAIKQQQEDLKKENENIALELQGLPTDLLGKTSRWIAEKKSMITSTFDEVSIDELVNKLDNSVKTVLTLMALFIFKTLVLPLLFMAALMWGAKQIWNFDLKQLFEDKLRRTPTAAA